MCVYMFVCVCVCFVSSDDLLILLSFLKVIFSKKSNWKNTVSNQSNIMFNCLQFSCLHSFWWKIWHNLNFFFINIYSPFSWVLCVHISCFYFILVVLFSSSKQSSFLHLGLLLLFFFLFLLSKFRDHYFKKNFN